MLTSLYDVIYYLFNVLAHPLPTAGPRDDAPRVSLTCLYMFIYL